MRAEWSASDRERHVGPTTRRVMKARLRSFLTSGARKAIRPLKSRAEPFFIEAISVSQSDCAVAGAPAAAAPWAFDCRTRPKAATAKRVRTRVVLLQLRAIICRPFGNVD